MENQPIVIEGLKPLAMSAMKRDGLVMEGENVEEALVKPKDLPETVEV